MFRFAELNMLYLLLLIPVMVAIYMLVMRARSKRLELFGDMTTLGTLMPEVSLRRVRTKFIIYLCAVTVLIFALARPQLGSKLKEVNREGIEIMFVVDVSNSMLAQDFEPNRLERTKFAINRLLEGLRQDKVGLIIFAGDAYVQLPITSDYTAARNFVNQISPNMVSKQGTAIGAAINLASNSFSSQSEGSRVIILISDGENHEDDAAGAALAAADKGVKIYAIGVGTPEGTYIEIGNDYIRDEEGNPVVTKLDEATLEQIALSTGGSYIRATRQSMGLTEIVEKVNETEKTQFTAQVFDRFDEQYQYLIAIAIALLLIEMLIIDRRNRILSRLNIFRKD